MLPPPSYAIVYPPRKAARCGRLPALALPCARWPGAHSKPHLPASRKARVDQVDRAAGDATGRYAFRASVHDGMDAPLLSLSDLTASQGAL